MSLLVDQGVPEGTCSQVLRSTSVDSCRFESIKFSVCLEFIQIVIFGVYYTIPFGSTLFWHFGAYFFNFLNYFLWLRITDEGLVPEMRIWSILLIKSDLKWCIHVSRSLFFNCITNTKRVSMKHLSHVSMCTLRQSPHPIIEILLICVAPKASFDTA